MFRLSVSCSRPITAFINILKQSTIVWITFFGIHITNNTRSIVRAQRTIKEDTWMQNWLNVDRLTAAALRRLTHGAKVRPKGDTSANSNRQVFVCNTFPCWSICLIFNAILSSIYSRTLFWKRPAIHEVQSKSVSTNYKVCWL